jgi:hypothetical protein
MFDKLKNLFSKEGAEEQAWQQRGAGRKLGTAEPQHTKPHGVQLGATAAPTRQAVTATQPGAGAGGGLGLPIPAVPKPRSNSLTPSGPSGPMPRSSSRPSDCNHQILDQVVMANTPTGRALSLPGALANTVVPGATYQRLHPPLWAAVQDVNGAA